MTRMLARNGILICFLMLTSSVSFAEMQSVKDHQALANNFEEKAKVYEKFIVEHKSMLEDYQSSNRSYEHQEWDDSFPSPQFLLSRMEGHCKGIIKAATSLREDMLEFAKLHRMKAAAMQNKS